MPDSLVKDALNAQASVHLMEATRLAGSSFIRQLIQNAFVQARAEAPSEALLEELDRMIQRNLAQPIIIEATKSAELAAKAREFA